MNDYRVNLDIFSGPLDLLLYLVRKDEVDIYDIPITRITDQYLRYIEMLKSFDIDLASEFLVMAATLIEIKSAMLLPKAETSQEQEGQVEDPRMELIRQLLEYKKFKDAANVLGVSFDRQSERFVRPDSIVEKIDPQTEPQVDIDQISIWELLDAFDSIIKATGGIPTSRLIKDDTPIDLYQIELLHKLQTEGHIRFEQIFEGKNNRLVMVGLFLALLELIRSKLVWVEQEKPAEPIYLRALTNEPAEQAVQKAIMTTIDVEHQQPASEETTPPDGENPSQEKASNILFDTDNHNQ